MINPDQYVVTPVTNDPNTGAIFKMNCPFNEKVIKRLKCAIFYDETKARKNLRLKLKNADNGLSIQDIDDSLKDEVLTIVINNDRHVAMRPDGTPSRLVDIPCEKDMMRPSGYSDDLGIGIEDFLIEYSL